MQQERKLIKDQGYVILKNFFPKEYLERIREGAERIFQIQFDRFGFDDDFRSNMIRLFNEQEEVFVNCGKIIQSGLIDLYKLPSK